MLDFVRSICLPVIGSRDRLDRVTQHRQGRRQKFVRSAEIAHAQLRCATKAKFRSQFVTSIGWIVPRATRLRQSFSLGSFFLWVSWLPRPFFRRFNGQVLFHDYISIFSRSCRFSRYWSQLSRHSSEATRRNFLSLVRRTLNFSMCSTRTIQMLHICARITICNKVCPVWKRSSHWF